MRRDEQIELPFVQDDQGALRYVSDFAGTPAEGLPEVRCPGCQQPVRLHLRDVAIPHATHADPLAGLECMPPPATLEREAARVHLRDELRRARSLKVVRHCARCRSRHEVELARGWDEVHAGKPLGAQTPDVLVTHWGEPMVAIEIFTSPELSSVRLAELQWRRLPWIQVQAREVLYPPWKASTALRVDRFPSGPWTCPDCWAKRGRGPALEALVAMDTAEDTALESGSRRFDRRDSSYRLTRRVRARYAPAGTLVLRADAGAVQPSREGFAHVGLERIVEVTVAGELVRIHLSVAVWSTAVDREVLALTYRMMEGEQLSNPRPLATGSLTGGADPAGWRALMERARQALAEVESSGAGITFDSGWRMDRPGCGCPVCAAGHGAALRRDTSDRVQVTGPRPLPARREPQLELFADEFVGMADELPDI